MDDMFDIFPELDDGDETYGLSDPVVSPWEKSFDELRESMIKLPEIDIYKKVVKEGLGKELTTQNARIAIHYNAYLENEAIAFDSSYLRGHPVVFEIGKEEIMPGIELAVKSMREGEESQFVISYKLLLGEMGCPPRVKPKADGLFIIQLHTINETGDEQGIEEISKADRNKFSVIMPKVEDVYKKGKDCFQRHNYSNASRLFHKAVSNLEGCRLNNEEEQKLQQDFIVKMYTNLAVCYLKMNLPRKTCLMCNEIRRISNIWTNCKALFQEGRALHQLGEFRKAQDRLTRAQRLQPTNAEITKELTALSLNFQKHTDNEKSMCMKAFGFIEPVKHPNAKLSHLISDTSKNNSFQKTINECISDFMRDGTQSQMHLPVGLASDEINYITDQIKGMSIKIISNDTEEKSYILKKN